MKRFLTGAACVLCLIAGTACTQKSEGPAEQAGKKTDEAVQETKAEAGTTAEKAAEEAGGTLPESKHE